MLMKLMKLFPELTSLFIEIISLLKIYLFSYQYFLIWSCCTLIGWVLDKNISVPAMDAQMTQDQQISPD